MVQLSANFPKLKLLLRFFLYIQLISTPFQIESSLKGITPFHFDSYLTIEKEKCHHGKLPVLKVQAAAESCSVLDCLTLISVNKLADPQMMHAFISKLFSFKLNKVNQTEASRYVRDRWMLKMMQQKAENIGLKECHVSIFDHMCSA